MVLLKQCLHQIAPTITHIINSSLANGIFPHSCKSAIVRPLLKKPGLDSNALKNYRPVSNLPYLSKLIEKAALLQINSYLCNNNLYAKSQSAYREAHSTETALVRVQNDVLRALDRRNEVILILLDLSAAFDTIDHNILIHRLRCRFRIDGTVLEWIKSYLKDRTMRVCVGSAVSEAQSVECGVPQGSVLGPILFSLYVAPLEDIIVKHGLDSMFYADDSQLYVTCSRDFVPITQIEGCINDLRQWMGDNMLALNDGKTEVIHFSSRFADGGRSRECSLQVGKVSVHSSPVVRNLGVMLDTSASMSFHVTSLCKSASFALWKISKIRNFLDQSSTEKLVHAFITSRLDYCNSLLYGLPSQQLKKLQLIQNSAARLVTRTKKTEHITPILSSLHWLPIYKRTEFKILCLTYKVVHGMAPVYLTDLLSVRTPGRLLRSTTEGVITLHQPICNTVYYGERSFAVCAPRLWNKLPFGVRTSPNFNVFKSNLKTHLFKNDTV